MRASLSVVIVLLLATAGSRGVVEAQGGDQAWWEWAGEKVSREAVRIAVPREEAERESRTRTPSTGRDERVVTTDRRTEAQAPAGRGRGAGRGEASPPQGRGRGNGGGPAFCRSGAGHPVFGWEWCAQRGFSRGRPEWRREAWGNRVPRWPRQPRDERIDSGRLIVILGNAVYGQLQGHARQIDARGPLEGRWLRPASNTLVLQIRAGDVPIAELSDITGDRRVDTVLVNHIVW